MEENGIGGVMMTLSQRRPRQNRTLVCIATPAHVGVHGINYNRNSFANHCELSASAAGCNLGAPEPDAMPRVWRRDPARPGANLVAAEAKRFGFNHPTGIELPCEYRTQHVADPAWRTANWKSANLPDGIWLFCFL